MGKLDGDISLKAFIIALH